CNFEFRETLTGGKAWRAKERRQRTTIRFGPGLKSGEASLRRSRERREERKPGFCGLISPGAAMMRSWKRFPGMIFSANSTRRISYSFTRRKPKTAGRAVSTSLLRTRRRRFVLRKRAEALTHTFASALDVCGWL